MDGGTWKAAVHGVAEGQTRLSNFTFTFHFHALEKEMATHSSILAWRIPGTGEPVGLPSMGSHRVRHDLSDLAAAVAAAHSLASVLIPFFLSLSYTASLILNFLHLSFTYEDSYDCIEPTQIVQNNHIISESSDMQLNFSNELNFPLLCNRTH